MFNLSRIIMISLLSITLGLLHMGCGSDELTITETKDTIGRLTTEVNFVVIVLDNLGNPIVGADIYNFSNGVSYCTNGEGIVIFKNIALPSTGGQIKIDYPGYNSEIRLLEALENSYNSHHVTLTKNDSGLTETTMKSANLEGGGQLTLPSSMRLEDGSLYQGPFMVTSKIFDQSSILRNAELRANLSSDNQVGISFLSSLVSYDLSVITVDGSTLSIPTDSTATVVLPNISSTADSLIYYTRDEIDLIWKRNGFFKLNETEYSGEITSLQAFNVALEYQPAYINFLAVDADGFIANNLKYLVSIEGDETYYIATGITNNSGNGFVKVPRGISLELFPFSAGELGNPIFIDPVYNNSDLGTIDMGVDLTPINGTILDCENKPDSNAILIYGQSTYRNVSFTENGDFQLGLTTSSSTDLLAVNIEDKSKSEILVLGNPSDGLNIGSIKMCEEVVDYEDIIVNSPIIENTTWRSCNTYIIDDLIYVEPGITLTVEAGTLIKANPGIGSQMKGLVISKGAKIEAIGTANNPIIFTSTEDDIDNGSIYSSNLSENTKGLWAGLFILGEGIINSSNSETSLSELDPENNLSFYGGMESSDNSGTLKYVSIRHAGTESLNGKNSAGLTLAGTGIGTDIDHVEIYGSGGDGIKVLGGNVSIDDFLAYNNQGYGITSKQSWEGTIDNFILSLDDNSEGTINIVGGQEISTTTQRLLNGTGRGSSNSENGKGDYTSISVGAAVEISNCYFFGYSEQSNFNLRDINSAQQYIEGNILFVNLEFKTDHLSSGNISIESIFLDESGQDVFNDISPGATLVTTPTVGASKNSFNNWSWIFESGLLDDF